VSGGSGDHNRTGEDPDASARLTDWSDSPYHTALHTALLAATTAWVTPAPTTFSYAAATGKVTIAYSAADFTLTWSTDAGRDFCGFSADQSGAGTYTSDQTPSMVIAPTSGATSLSTPNYEPDGIGSVATSNDGQSVGIARTVSPLYRDWVQQYETKAKTLRLAAASTHPATMQKLFEECRGVYPFVVSDGFGESYDEVFRLRNDGMNFSAERATPGNDAQFHINFRAIVEGKILDTAM
jgi:hypothetical protein